MEIRHFDDLLQAARAQPERQRLLLMFAARELPDAATATQQAQYERGEGGALRALMCVDKKLEELNNFQALSREAAQHMGPQGLGWDVVFVGALSGVLDAEPTDAEVDRQLERMFEALKTGQMAAYLAFNTQGEPLMLD